MGLQRCTICFSIQLPGNQIYVVFLLFSDAGITASTLFLIVFRMLFTWFSLCFHMMLSLFPCKFLLVSSWLPCGCLTVVLLFSFCYAMVFLWFRYSFLNVLFREPPPAPTPTGAHPTGGGCPERRTIYIYI